VSGERPFVSPGAAVLERDGYFRRHDDGSADFYGPDEDVLLSDGFTRRHCIVLSAIHRDSTGTQLALSFSPRDGDQRPEIRGLIWIDSVTSELRRIQFEYLRVPLPVAADSLGGSVEFAHLASGGWIISSWMLRIPHFAYEGAGVRIAPHARLDAHIEVGGRAAPVRDVQIPGPNVPRQISGVAYDSLADRPLSGARVHVGDLGRDRIADSTGRFSFDSIPPGIHSIWVDHPALDSLGLFSLGARIDATPTVMTNVLLAIPSFATIWRRTCSSSVPDGSVGLIFGTVTNSDASEARSQAAEVTWRVERDTVAGSAQVRADSTGSYAICNAPLGSRLVLIASSGERSSPRAMTLIGPRRVARLDLPLMSRAALAALAADSARATGSRRYRLRVLSEQGDPIAYANVSLDGGAVHTTNEFGELGLGATMPEPTTATVRRIGFEPWTGRAKFSDSMTVITIPLKRTAQLLGTVRVGAQREASSPFLKGFYDRWEQAQKGALSGTFIGPEEIEFRHPSKVTRMLQGLNGVRLICDPHGDCAVQASHPGAIHIGDGCPMAIALDGQQLYGQVNIDQMINANDVMAIEVYPRGGNTPISLQLNDTKCGLVAFWTGSRR
jgi:hypothetical protein